MQLVPVFMGSVNCSLMIKHHGLLSLRFGFPHPPWHTHMIVEPNNNTSRKMQMRPTYHRSRPARPPPFWLPFESTLRRCDRWPWLRRRISSLLAPKEMRENKTKIETHINKQNISFIRFHSDDHAKLSKRDNSMHRQQSAILPDPMADETRLNLRKSHRGILTTT